MRNTQFFVPAPFSLKFKNVLFEQHAPIFVRGETRQRSNYPCKKFLTKTYPRATIYP